MLSVEFQPIRRSQPFLGYFAKSITRPIHYREIGSSKKVVPTRNEQTVVFSGIQPTGVPHIGNYLGALQQWVRLQSEALNSTRLLYSIVDLHALTNSQNAEQLRRQKRETLAALLAVGLDPERSTIFYQSAV